MAIVPLLIAFYGPYKSVLYSIPSDQVINRALVVMIASMVAFSTGYLLTYSRGRARARATEKHHIGWGIPPAGLELAYIGLGILGMALAFGSLGALKTYLTSPGLAYEAVLGASSTVLGLAANVLRPFLGMGLVLVWCRRLDRTRGKSRLRDSLATAAVLVLALFAYGTFSYNRGSIAVPIVCMLAVFSRRVRRFKAFELVAIGGIGLILLGTIGFYRSSGFTSSRLLSRQGVTSVRDSLDFNHQIQVYGNGPQFLGFLLENSDALTPSYGRTSASAVLFPIPVLGKPFRPTSGAVIYNRWIYGAEVGGLELGDQIAPFAGEVSMDFRTPGVIAGFLILGLAIARLQLRFERTSSALELYVTQFTAVWLAFLVIGSLEVVSQIFVYFFWPIYILVGYELLRRRRLERRTASTFCRQSQLQSDSS
jgi:hypothetical protein